MLFAVKLNVHRDNAGDKASPCPSPLACRGNERASQTHQPQRLAGIWPFGTVHPDIPRVPHCREGQAENRVLRPNDAPPTTSARRPRRVDGRGATPRRKEVDNRRQRAP